MRVRNTRKVGPWHQKRDETMEPKGEDPFFTSLQKLDDELTCPVCSDHFKEPKVLPCLHFYCKTCIAKLIKRAKGRPFSCPECRRETSADGDNPESLPTAFLVNRMEELFSVMKKAERKDSVTCESCRSRLPAVDFCHECSKYICTDCSKAHKQMWLLSSHRVVSIDSLRSTISSNPPEKLRVVVHEVKCRKHKDEALKLYCEDCHRLVCRDCIVIDHKDHEYAFVIDAAPLCKAEIKEKSESVKEITEGVKSVIKSLGDSKKKLSDHGTATARAIDEAIDEIVTKLAEKRKELKEKACRIVSDAEEKIVAEEKNAQLAVGELESLLEFMNRSLETATDQEVLSLKKQVADQVARVTKLYGDAEEKFPVPELPDLVVKCGEGVKEVIESEISVAEIEKMVAKSMEQLSVNQVARSWECAAPDFSGPPITEPDFSGPPITEPDFSGPPITEPDLSGPPIDFSGPPITEPDLSGPPIDFSGLPITKPDFSGPPITEPDFFGPPIDFSGPPITKPDFSGPPIAARDLSGPPIAAPDFSGPPIAARDLSGPPITKPDFSGPPIAACDLSGPPIAAPDLSGHAVTMIQSLPGSKAELVRLEPTYRPAQHSYQDKLQARLVQEMVTKKPKKQYKPMPTLQPFSMQGLSMPMYTQPTVSPQKKTEPSYMYTHSQSRVGRARRK